MTQGNIKEHLWMLFFDTPPFINAQKNHKNEDKQHKLLITETKILLTTQKNCNFLLFALVAVNLIYYISAERQGVIFSETDNQAPRNCQPSTKKWIC